MNIDDRDQLGIRSWWPCHIVERGKKLQKKVGGRLVWRAACAGKAWRCCCNSDIADVVIGKRADFKISEHAKLLVGRIELIASRFSIFIATIKRDK